MTDYPNIIGNIGVLCFLSAYFLLQKEKVTHRGRLYLGLNLAGALMVIYSLMFDWNLPSFLLEAAWTMITMYGIYKYHIKREA